MDLKKKEITVRLSDPAALCDSQNLTPTEDGICGVWGYTAIASIGERLHSICPLGEEGLIVHAGGYIYLIKGGVGELSPRPRALCPARDTEGFAIGVYDVCYISDGEVVRRIDARGRVSELPDSGDIASFTLAIPLGDGLILSGDPNRPRAVTKLCPDGSRTEYSAPQRVLSLSPLSGGVVLLCDCGILGRAIMLDSALHPIDELNIPKPRSEGVGAGDKIYFSTDDGICILTDDGRLRQEYLPTRVTEGGECRLYPMPHGRLLALYPNKGYLIYPTEGEARGYPIRELFSHRGHRRIYRYSDSAPYPLLPSDTPGEDARGEIYGYKNAKGEQLYFSLEENKKYAVYPTERYEGGEAVAIDRALRVGKHIYLATPKADILTVGEELCSFDSHPIRCRAMLSPVDCGCPDKEKDSSGGRITLDLKAPKGSHIAISSVEDGRSIHVCRTILSSDTDGAISLPDSSIRWKRRAIIIDAYHESGRITLRSVGFGYRIIGGITKGKK